MFRRLAKLALAFSLVTASATPALAGFAQPPDAGPASAPRQYRIDVETRHEIERPTPSLSQAARARLRTVLAKRRAKNVKSFATYVARRRYPHNFEQPGALNVWIDQEGRMCAAATMIFASSASMRPLVRQQAELDNFIRLADVSDGALYDWILTSGLTHAEVVAIQEPFMGRRPAPDPNWRIAEDNRLRARYAEVQRQLAADRADSLEAAIDALAYRPDLVAKLIAR